MTNVTNISISTRNKAVVAAIKADPALAGKACLAVDLLADKGLYATPAAGIIAMLRHAPTTQAVAAHNRPTGSAGNSDSGWAKATAAANAAYGL